MTGAKIVRLATNTIAMLHDRMQKAESRGEHGVAAAYAAALRDERAAVEVLFAVRVTVAERRSA